MAGRITEMIVGDGDIASVLPDKEGFTFFASGVSNSQETRYTEFQREINLLMRQDKTKHIVYFGSLAIFYSNTPYARHKRNMEKIVKDNFPSWTIIRLGNITWGTNPNTIINYMRNVLKTGGELEIRDEKRFVVEKDEFLYWINLIPDWNCEMNLSGQFLTIKQIVEKYVTNS